MSLEELLQQLHDRDLARVQAYLASRSDCLPLTRLRGGILQEDWNEEEELHLKECSACARQRELLRSELWHPSAWQIAGSVLALVSAEQAVGEHLEGCRRCRRLATWIEKAGWLSDLGERLQEFVER